MVCLFQFHGVRKLQDFVYMSVQLHGKKVENIGVAGFFSKIECKRLLCMNFKGF
jgi:hypothetical protein